VGIGYIEDDHLGMEGKEGRGRSHEGKQGATGGAKLGRSWRSKSMIEGRDGDLLKRGIL
jgi:hypothetical protein